MVAHTGKPRELTDDSIFELLSNERRRRLLCLLSLAGGSADLRELARWIAAAETGGTVDDRSYWRVYVSLTQTHVPKLEGFGVVEYVPDHTELVSAGRFEDVHDVLFPDDRRAWPAQYVPLVAAAFVLFAWYVLAIQPTDIVATVVAVDAVILLGVLAVGGASTSGKRRFLPTSWDRLVARLSIE